MTQPVISAPWKKEELSTLMPRASAAAKVVSSCLSSMVESAFALMRTVLHRNTGRQMSLNAIGSTTHAPAIPLTIVVELGARQSTRSRDLDSLRNHSAGQIFRDCIRKNFACLLAISIPCSGFHSFHIEFNKMRLLSHFLFWFHCVSDRVQQHLITSTFVS